MNPLNNHLPESLSKWTDWHLLCRSLSVWVRSKFYGRKEKEKINKYPAEMQPFLLLKQQFPFGLQLHRHLLGWNLHPHPGPSPFGTINKLMMSPWSPLKLPAEGRVSAAAWRVARRLQSQSRCQKPVPSCVTFMSPMTVWKSPPSALHSRSITVSIFGNCSHFPGASVLHDEFKTETNKSDSRCLRAAFPGGWGAEGGRGAQRGRLVSPHSRGVPCLQEERHGAAGAQREVTAQRTHGANFTRRAAPPGPHGSAPPAPGTCVCVVPPSMEGRLMTGRFFCLQ